MPFTLRPYQLEALDAIKSAQKAGTKRQLVVLATALGKTVIMAAMRDHLSINGRVMVVVHRDELAQQTVDKFRRYGIKRVGIEMGASEASSADEVVVAGVATLGRSNTRRLLKYDPDEFKLIVVDEAHRGVAGSYQNIFDYFGVGTDKVLGDKLMVGLTATPNRSDGQGLVKSFDKITYEMGIKEGVDKGWLSPPRGFRVNTSVDLDDVHVRAGDFDIGELGAAVNTAARNDLIVRTWLERGEDRQTIAFAVDVQHSKDLAQTFRKYGVGAEAVWGDDPQRSEKLAQHRKKGLRVITNCAVCVEGYDDPSVACVIMARPTRSSLFFTQCIGRATRLQEGINNLKDALVAGQPVWKRDCLVFDIADTVGRHSLVSLPSLFGLGPKVNLQGRNVLETARAVEEARTDHPNVDFSKLEDVTKLKAFVEEVNLYKVTFAPEVLEHAKMQWVKIGDASYVLTLPSKEKVYVSQNFLDKWTVVGSVNKQPFDERDIPTMAEAFSFAEKMISVYGKEYVTLVRQKATWHKDQATEPQLGLLRKMRVPIPDGLTKGDAAKLITKNIAYRFHKKSA